MPVLNIGCGENTDVITGHRNIYKKNQQQTCQESPASIFPTHPLW